MDRATFTRTIGFPTGSRADSQYARAIRDWNAAGGDTI